MRQSLREGVRSPWGYLMFAWVLSSAGVFGGLTAGPRAWAFEAAPAVTPVPIPNFQEVDPGKVFRGGRPGEEGVAALARLGIRMDLNLENNEEVVQAEKEAAEALGIRFVSIPLSALWTPSDADIDQALSILSDPSQYPVFVHCHHGQDRTGLVVGLHRVLHEGWSKEAAYEEMKALGFHPMLFLLTRYFDARTGDQPLTRGMEPQLSLNLAL